MANSLKTWHPDFTFAGGKVGADEVDFYHTYVVNNPSIDATAIATAAGIASAVVLKENISALLDYPRNLRVTCAGGTSSGTYGGTVVVNGIDQFGNTITETISIATAVNGGTTLGTKIFARVDSGTATLSGDTAIATVNVGYSTAGTTTLFGLPFKMGGTKDLLHYNWASAHAVQAIATAAVGSYAGTSYSYVKARSDFGTAAGFSVWVKSTKNQSEDTANNTDKR
jgi:hypothetical protein